MRSVRGIVLRPTPAVAAEVFYDGPCFARPPQARLLPGGRVFGGGPHGELTSIEADDRGKGPMPRLLVLAWDGRFLRRGMDVAKDALGEAFGIDGSWGYTWGQLGHDWYWELRGRPHNLPARFAGKDANPMDTWSVPALLERPEGLADELLPAWAMGVVGAADGHSGVPLPLWTYEVVR